MARQSYKGPISGPCSACGDGDTAMRYHDHNHERRTATTTETNVRQFPPRGKYAAIYCHLPQLRELMEEFVADMQALGHTGDMTDWKFETFLQWAANKQKKGQATDGRH